LIPSVSESLLVLLSHIRHSPKAMVLLVPSMTSRLLRCPLVPGVWVEKMPLLFAEVQGQTPGPTEPK